MNEDLFESLLPPIKTNYEPKVEPKPVKEEINNEKELDLNKIWEEINSDSVVNSSFSNVGNNSNNSGPGKVLYLSSQKRKTPVTEPLVTPSAKAMRLITAGDESRRIFQSALLNRTLALQHQQQQKNQTLADAVADSGVPNAQEEEEEGRTNTEIYAQYQPAKLKKGKMHPYPVVESSSLASVEAPNIRYNLSLPSEVLARNRLSNVQIEAVVYACQRHEEILPSGERAGYLIGDGAGVGKGRILAAIIYENYLQHRKRSIWVSVSNDLKHDAERDIRDLGALEQIQLHALNKMKYAKINSPENGNVRKGVLYSTYASLIGECQGANRGNTGGGSNNPNNGGKYKTRFRQIIQWFGSDYDGVIVFDECHKAKNLMPQGSQKKTKTAELVLKLQEALPKARIVYASATGASEPRNMAYMTRLGLWGKGTPFPKFEDFVEKLEDKVGAMELIAVDMKQRGMYIARQLSFANVTFRVNEVKLADVKLGEWRFLDVYNESVLLWRKLHDRTIAALNELSTINSHKWGKTVWGQFWAAHQRFFKYLVMGGKVQECVAITMDAITQQKCVVIGLQSTGESKTNEMLMLDDEESSGEFVSCAKGILQTLVERFFPTRDNIRYMERQQQANLSEGGGKGRGRKAGGVGGGRKRGGASGGLSLQDALPKDFLERVVGDTGSSSSSGEDDDSDLDSLDEERGGFDDDGINGGTLLGADENETRSPEQDVSVKLMQQELLDDVRRLAPKLPINTLDALIRELGGTDYVAEMTGRKGRMVMDTATGEVSYQSRREEDVTMEQVNLVEKERFNSCHKLVAIISDAASTGISLHADQRYDNPLQRVHITLELPWSADRAIQQFGRTHRSNQAVPPQYVFLISDLAGERRFASTVAKRLESLGALTHGDRRATETRDLSRFNIDNKFGRRALDMVFDYAFRGRASLVPPPQQQSGSALRNIQDELLAVGLLPKDSKNVSKFLNRILGMRLEVQNGLFQYYTDTMDELVRQAKRNQEFDRGIIDLAKEDDNIFVEETRDFQMQFLGDDIKVQLHRVKNITGMSWTSACETLEAARRQKRALEISGLGSTKDLDGFWETRSSINKRIVLAVRSHKNQKENDSTNSSSRSAISSTDVMYDFVLYSPNIGEQTTRLDQRTLSNSYSRLTYGDGNDFIDGNGESNGTGTPVTAAGGVRRAEQVWNDIYSTTEVRCLHQYWQGDCRTSLLTGRPCEFGCRSKVRYVLSGSIFYIWDIISSIHKSPQLARVRLNDGSKIIGCLINHNNKDKIVEILSSRGKPSIVQQQQNLGLPTHTSHGAVLMNGPTNLITAISNRASGPPSLVSSHSQNRFQPPPQAQPSPTLIPPPQFVVSRSPTLHNISSISNSTSNSIHQQPQQPSLSGGTVVLRSTAVTNTIGGAAVRIVPLTATNPPALRFRAATNHQQLSANTPTIRLIPSSALNSNTTSSSQNNPNITHVFAQQANFQGTAKPTLLSVSNPNNLSAPRVITATTIGNNLHYKTITSNNNNSQNNPNIQRGPGYYN